MKKQRLHKCEKDLGILVGCKFNMSQQQYDMEARVLIKATVFLIQKVTILPYPVQVRVCEVWYVIQGRC